MIINPRLLMMLGGLSIVSKIISGYFGIKVWRAWKAGTLKADTKALWYRTKQRFNNNA